MLKAGLLVTLLLVGGQRVMRWWLTLVARRKSEELFMLNLLLVTLGLAWLTELAGLSLALGAFIAGMLVSETEYKHQVEADIRPFHDVLLGLFFITIGMMLDWHIVLDRWGWCWCCCWCRCCSSSRWWRCWRAPWAPPAAWRCAPACTWRRPANSASCCCRWREHGCCRRADQPGPGGHGAVDAGHALPHHVQQPHRDEAGGQRLAAAVAADDHHRAQVHQHQQARDHLRLRPQRPEPGAHAGARRHSYMALDLDPDRVRQAAAAGDSVVFGDAARLQA
jgi:CPA2 family monovalent cation:H+ antiporter-2